jgi:hypothetical protein
MLQNCGQSRGIVVYSVVGGVRKMCVKLNSAINLAEAICYLVR